MKAVILAGGRLVASDRLLPRLQGAGLVVAADSGLRHAAALGLEPALAVGDFDSLDPAVLRRHAGIALEAAPARKDELDLELAVAAALRRGARELVVLGAFGSRLDQSLACLMVAARLRRRGVTSSLHDGERDAYVLAAGDRLRLALPPGTVFSLLALESAQLSVTGAAFELQRAPLPFGVGLGVSNVARGGPEVEVQRGLVTLLVEWTVQGPGDRLPE